MINKVTRRLEVGAAVMIGLSGCKIPQPASQVVPAPVADRIIGSVLPVYNPPPNKPFPCVGGGYVFQLFSVPGDATIDLGLRPRRRPRWAIGAAISAKINELKGNAEAKLSNHETRLTRIETIIEIAKPDGSTLRIAPPKGPPNSG